MERISLRETDEEESRGFLERTGASNRRDHLGPHQDEMDSLVSNHDDSDDEGVSKEEKKRADLAVIRNLMVNGLLIGLWYDAELSHTRHCN